jgi:(2Fe-2S) ferredoxin
VSKREHYLFVCQNVRPDGSPRPSCGRNGSPQVYAALKAELQRRGLSKTLARACTSSCLDMCDDGPIIGVEPQNAFYGHMTVERVPALVQALLDGSTVQEFLVQSATLEESNEDR